jgi:hypothetical protein
MSKKSLDDFREKLFLIKYLKIDFNNFKEKSLNHIY